MDVSLARDTPVVKKLMQIRAIGMIRIVIQIISKIESIVPWPETHLW